MLEECHSAHLHPTLGLKSTLPRDVPPPPIFLPCRQESGLFKLSMHLLGCAKVQEPEQGGGARAGREHRAGRWSTKLEGSFLCVELSPALVTREWQVWGIQTKHLATSLGPIPWSPLGPSEVTPKWRSVTSRKGTLQLLLIVAKL